MTAEFDISRHVVEKHFELIYVRLGTESRRAGKQMVFGADS
jgi:hypothetical protein